MRVALAQMTPHLGDVNKNLELHRTLIAKAKHDGVDLLVFPELSLTGYTLKDLVQEVALIPDKSPVFQELKELSRELPFVCGFVEDKDTGLLFNSAAYFSGGDVLHIHRKVYLPTYGMFEEAKFFAQGKNFITFPTPFGKVGLMICYDFLHYGASYLLFSGGADLIITISAAPGRGFPESGEEAFATCHMWELMGETISRFSTAFVIYCNRVGFEDGKAFAGGSFIYSPGGELLAKASYTEEELLLLDIDLDSIQTWRKKLPYRRDNKPEIILEALKRVVSRYED
jgi:predicted amidohydrolase